MPMEDLVISKSPEGLLVLNASVRNNHTFQVHHIKIILEFFDKDENSLCKIEGFDIQSLHTTKPEGKFV